MSNENFVLGFAVSKSEKKEGPDSCLRLFREKLNLSQKEMATRLHIEQRTYAHYEQRLNARLPIDVLQNLRGMGLNLNWLFTGQGEMKIGTGINPLLPGKQVSDEPNPPEVVKQEASITGDHIAEAWILVKAGLGKHSLPVATEAALISHVVEGLALGLSKEEILRDFEEAVARALEERYRRHRKG